MIRIVHISTSLTTGGAQAMLYKLLSATDQSRYEVHVISLMDKSTYGQKIESLGIPVHCLHMRNGFSSMQAIGKLRALSKSIQPDIVQGWMYHANIAANLFRWFSNKDIALAWNIRHSLYEVSKEKPLTRLMIRAGARLSSGVDSIIYNSRVSSQQHKAFGYDDRRQTILPNGFDTQLFKPSELARAKLRQSLSLSQATPIIGIVGRFHPMKCHTNFIRAASRVYMQRPDVHFVMLGHSVNRDNPVLGECLASLSPDANKNFHLLGERTDVPELTPAFDIAVLSSSWGEAFPNVIGEAMSCGIPCVVTDVGDAAYVLDGCGIVTPPADVNALTQGITTLLNINAEERSMLGVKARQRIVDNFSLPNVSGTYASLYDKLAEERGVNL